MRFLKNLSTPALFLGPFLSLFFAPLAHSALPDFKRHPEASPVQAPSNILYLGDQEPSYAFLVDKSEQRLYVYRQEAEGQKLIKTFVCSTGENSLGKKRRGDKRTPEGVYFFTRVMESKNLPSIYGIRAFPMDYPNFLDQIHYHKGDGIWLHGTNKPLAPYSTNGCIVLENSEVVELSQYVRLRRTPIIIVEKIPYTSPKELNGERDRVRSLLLEWKRSWEKKQLDRYMSFYSHNFRSKDMDWNGWRRYKERLNQQYRTIQITIDPPIILKHNQNTVAKFFQSYQSDRFFSEGTKRLYFATEGGDLKIIGEEWEVHRGGEAPPPISEAVLAAFLTPKTPIPEAGTASSPSPSPASLKAKREKPEGDLSQEVPKIQAFLATWKRSWETKDLNQYMDCYSKDFRAQGKKWEQWRQYKKHLNARYRQIQVSLEDVKIQRKDGQTLVSFRQIYRSDGLKSIGQKNLTLREEKKSWKIIRESFSRFKGEDRGG